MPRTYYRLLPNAEINVWKAEKNESFYRSFLEKNDFPLGPAEKIKSSSKRRQWLASRYALTQVYPEAVQYYKDQKPSLLNGPRLSISHSEDDIALMLSTYEPGIDIQWPNEKLLKISDKFLTEDDLKHFQDMEIMDAHCIIWSIKEAIFKQYGSGVIFKNVRIKDYDPAHNFVATEVKRFDRIEEKELCADFIGKMAIAYILE